MLQRRSFIKAKYVNRKFVTSTTRVFRTDSSTSPPNGEEQQYSGIEDSLSERFLRRDLLRAVKQCELAALLQVIFVLLPYYRFLDLQNVVFLRHNDDDSSPFLTFYYTSNLDYSQAYSMRYLLFQRRIYRSSLKSDS
ncbi:unnamed protein product [Dicrocoelium dendriticum]|nr:unnamed protein product [Dicrocoelium dendriticum]